MKESTNQIAEKQVGVTESNLLTNVVFKAVLVGLSYLLLAELGHLISLKAEGQTFATIWPAAGLLLAVLARTPLRQWPTMLSAACVAILVSNVLLHHKPLLVSFGFCVANCAESCLGAWLLCRFVGTHLTMTRVRHVVALAILSAVLSTILGAVIGAGIVAWAFGAPFFGAWKTWWASDALGVLIVAPVVLNLLDESDVIPRVKIKGVWIEAGALFLGMVLVASCVYGDVFPPPLALPIFILPFLLWAGLRFSRQGAAVALLFVALIGVWNISQGRGLPLSLRDDPASVLVKAQATLCVVCFSVLTMAATVAERKQADEQRIKLISELEQALAEIKTLQGLIPICAWCKKIRDDQGFWRRLEDYLRARTQAEFTHGICPDCFEKQLTTLSDTHPE